MRKLGVALTACVALTAPRAHAQQADEPATRLAAILHDEAKRQHDERMAAGGIAFGLAAMTGGFGAACFVVQPSTQADKDGFVIGGVTFEAVAVLSVVLGTVSLSVPTDLEKLARDYDTVMRDPSRPDKLAWGETHLGDLAEREHRSRILAATLGIAVSPIVVGLGIAGAALMPSGTDDVLRASYVAFFSLLGLVDLTVGVIRLFSLDPAERLWRTWRIGTGRMVSASPWVAPLRAGGAAGVTLSF